MIGLLQLQKGVNPFLVVRRALVAKLDVLQQHRSRSGDPLGAQESGHLPDTWARRFSGAVTAVSSFGIALHFFTLEK